MSLRKDRNFSRENLHAGNPPAHRRSHRIIVGEQWILADEESIFMYFLGSACCKIRKFNFQTAPVPVQVEHGSIVAIVPIVLLFPRRIRL